MVSCTSRKRRHVLIVIIRKVTLEPSVNTTEQKSNELSNEHATAAPAVVVAVDKNEANEEKEAERPAAEEESSHNNVEPQQPFEDEGIEDGTVDADFIMDNKADEEVIAKAEAIAETTEEEEESKSSKDNHLSLAVSLLIAAITAAVLLFLYNQEIGSSKANPEQDAYAQAISSNEATVLKNYLDVNPSAPKAHRDSIAARLKALTTTTANAQQANNDLAVALASNSKDVYSSYVAKYPNSYSSRGDRGVRLTR